MINSGHLILITVMISTFMLMLVALISIVLVRKNKKARQITRWHVKTSVLITKAIFAEENDSFFIPINRRITVLLQKPLFRQTLIDELVLISKNIAGASAENLAKLYKQLRLDKDSQKNFNHFKWHKKTKGIQELATMQFDSFSHVLYTLSDHKNEYVRMEAQTSMVKLERFEGLSFLNEITYPISEWHQINLLKELANIPAGDFQGIENWLKSKNDSVVIFALKLTASYHQFQLYDKIVECLKHRNPKVQLQAIRCLKDIYEDTTVWHLINIFHRVSKTHQLEILKALHEIASVDSLPFLQFQLDSEDNHIKLAAVKALFNCGVEGMQIIERYPEASKYPLNEIIEQVLFENRT